MPHQLQVEGGFNVRDMGGYRTADGKSTRSHVLIRAGNLDKISPAAQQQLIDYGVKTVIDLRDEWEVENFPDVFAQSSSVRYVNLPLINHGISNSPAWKAESDAYATLDQVYAMYLERCQPQLGRIVTTIADSTFGTLFHCYAGKDRTGIVAALLLGSVGVPDSIIAVDYAQTSEHVAHLIPGWRDNALLEGHDMGRFERNVSSTPETMLNMLMYIGQRYGSITNYLRTCGVSSDQLERLRTHFIQ